MGLANIHVLSSDVVDQIAAGEVLERPSHMVKELVENALDAGATSIEVEYASGGRYVRVTDNGEGMSPEDLRLAFLRHATSKIKKGEDLWNLSTFGFRGEALASVAAVARVQMTSRRSEGSAYRIQALFGKLTEVEPAAGNLGTCIEVQDLFENIPVRLKFLKSETAEHSSIKLAMKALAMAHPSVEFRLRSQGKTVALWPKAENMRERVEQVLEITDLFEAERDHEGFSAHAVFADPKEATRGARSIWIFVQGRWVQDRGLQAAILEAHQNLLMQGEYPVVCLFLKGPPDKIDVNIHPTKSAVKFQDSSVAFRAVHRCLREALEKAPWNPNAQMRASAHAQAQAYDHAQVQMHGDVQPSVFTPWQKSQEATGFFRAQPAFSVPRGPTSRPPEITLPMDEIPRSQISTVADQQSPYRVDQREMSCSLPEVVGYWAGLKIIGQADLTYIIAENSQGLVLIDQHAAHERVMFEKLQNELKSGVVVRQALLVPLVVDLDAQQVESLQSVVKDLDELGLELELLGPTSVAIRSIPAGLKEAPFAKLIDDISREIMEWGGSQGFEKHMGDILARMACHSAVRAGQSLTPQQMRELLQQMDDYPLSSYCPHGRPVSIDWVFSQIERDFGRIV